VREKRKKILLENIIPVVHPTAWSFLNKKQEKSTRTEKMNKHIKYVQRNKKKTELSKFA
jgi:hypothetical protein